MSSYDFPDLSDLEITLLVKFVEFADKNELTRVDVRNIQTNTKDFGIRPIMLKATFNKLRQKSLLSLVRESHHNGDDDYYYEISSDYADQIDSYVSFITNTTNNKTKSKNIPASDRFVAINHNSPDIQEAVKKLKEIEDRVDKSNELTANKEERLAIIREVKGIRELFSEPVVRLASIWSATRQNSLLIWLTQHGSDAVLKVMASEIVGYLLKIIGKN